jgi:hypothetical protein
MALNKRRTIASLKSTLFCKYLAKSVIYSWLKIAFFGADTATGNTVAPLDCDTSTVLIGDKTGLGGTRCRLKP